MQRITPGQFVAKWTASTLKEKSAAQEHFIDLCRLLDEPTPAEADPHGDWYCFERGAAKLGGRMGWADVWRKGFFAWEYKSKHKDLDAAFAQLQRYAIALENPPLLVVSDMVSIEVHTNFTNSVHQTHVIPIGQIGDEAHLRTLRWLFRDPEKLRPGQTRTALTAEAAKRFAALAQVLRDRGGESHRVAHFLNRVLFCLFAQHAKLLPSGVVLQLLEVGLTHPDKANQMLRSLFATMKSGGLFGAHVIEWFNGSLFDSEEGIPLEKRDVEELLAVANLDWSAIEPSIFGTLFERGLDPDKRAQIGAHYTDPKSIMRLLEPTIVQSLTHEWQVAKDAIIRELDQRGEHGTSPGPKTKAAAQRIFRAFLERLRNFRVLDPACGSGNFLYLALQALKDIEHRVNQEAEVLGLERQAPLVGPEALLGIEINSYAAELARVTVWIGEIQWMLHHGYSLRKNPILQSLKNISEQDAILTPAGVEPEWPNADVIVGNPPFLGGQRLRGALGDEYVRKLRSAYEGRVPGSADLVTYWHEKARGQLERKRVALVGLVATNSIRGGKNREVVDHIAETGTIFHAWSDEPWINEGAAVRVSLICFGSRDVQLPVLLDGRPVDAINSDLTAVAPSLNLLAAQPLLTNKNLSFQGSVKVGDFDISGETARKWLEMPNPHGRPNSDVLRPLSNAMDITRRPRDAWIVDFREMSHAAASHYEAPFQHVEQHIKPGRATNRDRARRENWWLHGRTGTEIRSAVSNLKRVIVTPRVAKHRLFVWKEVSVYCDDATVTIARDDDVTFGILHSRFHETWALRMGTSLEDRPRYTPTTTFETFPFPSGLTPNLSARDYLSDWAEPIAEAARNLVSLRDRWLNPPEWVRRVRETVPGYPIRLVPIENHARELAKRTLTLLYNARPTWLADAHAQLDVCVAHAYGWSDYTHTMGDAEILRRLLRLNAEQSQRTERPDAAIIDLRQAVLCTLVNRLATDPNFGRTKMAKLFYLADATENLGMETTYYRKAAGPLDPATLYNDDFGLESIAIKNEYVRVEKVGRRVRYGRGPRLKDAYENARALLGSHRVGVNKLIDLFRPLNTDQCEIIATLYACWNDRILEGQDTSDESIVNEFRESWHEKKRRFSKDRLLKALAWMKAHELVPTGSGTHTR